MRIATDSGRMVIISPDASSLVDIARISEGRFGPAPGDVYDFWEEFVDWAAVASIDFAAVGAPVVPERLGAPSPTPRQVFAIGLNYRDHADESGVVYPDSPPTFTKWVSSFAGPVGELALPAETVDWEAELVVVVGRRADKVVEQDAWSYVAGLSVGQDYSERSLQLAGPAPQFSLGKSYPGFAPQGPWLVTLDEVSNPDNLVVECRINGETVQKGSTADMIFAVPTLIARLSSVVALMPGDVIFTGTPAGVGVSRTPARFLQVGDVVETMITGLGSLRQVCTASR